jgi:hypothetical protein
MEPSKPVLAEITPGSEPQIQDASQLARQLEALERLAEIARLTGELDNPDFHNPLIR